MAAFNLKYMRYGERSILIEWPADIRKDILNDIIRFKALISKKLEHKSIELRSAYCSVLLIYGKSMVFEDEVEGLKQIYDSTSGRDQKKVRLWKIPVCYDIEFGIDLQLFSEKQKMSKDAIIQRHTKPHYTVYFVGFLPGFLYLGGLNASLFIPRRKTPRLKIPKGSVAIGGNQTGIYPMESPGGWHIIGNSPISFFNADFKQPCFATSGDKIEFVPISKEKYKAIKTLVDAEVYQIESEVISD